MRKIIAYTRVSTTMQELDAQKMEILNYAQKQKIIIDQFISVETSSQKTTKARKIDLLLNEVHENDLIIVSELSRLGRSVGNIIQIIDTLVQKKVALYAIKENLSIEGKQDIQTKIMVTLLSLFAEIERDLISERTKQGLALAREKGRLIGRPKGDSSSKLDQHKEEIVTLLKNGTTKVFIAKKFNTAYSNLFSWLKKQNLLTINKKNKI